MSPEQPFDRLDKILETMWTRIRGRARIFHAVEAGTIDRRLYALYMLETYHYTRHNARNQALVGVRAHDVSPQYQKFCFHHAEEETGHELMALHDVASLGLDKEAMPIPDPLPETETLIAYLYWVSLMGNPYQRLGYSYWAENVYHYIMPAIHALRDQLALSDHQLTFFIAHSEIDAEHAVEVQQVLTKNCATPQDWAAVERVMITSLNLTERMLEGVFDAYEQLRDGQLPQYNFLNTLS